MDGKKILNNILHWRWAESLLYWIIMSSATLSGLVLLLASIWISVNSNEHPLTQAIFGGGSIGEARTVGLTQIAVACFVGLPVVILIKVLVISLQHWQKFNYDPTLKSERFWAILYGVPAIVFLFLDIVTLGYSAVSSNYTAAQPIIVLRAEMGYLFALVALAYHYLGEPQAVKQLQDRDKTIAQLQSDIVVKVAEIQSKMDNKVKELVTNYTSREKELELQISSIRHETTSLLTGKDHELSSLADARGREIESLKEQLRESKERELRFQSKLNASNEDALQAYSEDCKKWLISGNKSATVDEIHTITGVHTRRINNAKENGDLKTTAKNKELITKSSLIEWLKTVEPTQLHVVNE